MPALNIFEDDAFSVSSLSLAINETQHVPGRLGELGIFTEGGIITTSMMIERKGQTLALVPNLPRGAEATVKGGEKRNMISVAATHLPQRATILADQVQNVRAFGSESEVDSVMNLVRERLATMRLDLDATIEYHRMGAIKGQILDADGSTVILDLLTTFDVSQPDHAMGLASDTTNVRNKIVQAKRKMEQGLGGSRYTGARALCSEEFWDDFVGHKSVAAAFDRWQNGEFFREDNRKGFYFGGVFWEEYRGKVGDTDFIEQGNAYMIPEGVPNLFVTKFAPADYTETVNTMGLPYYAKQELLRFNKGVEIESQSNPISLCSRPQTIVKLRKANS